MCFEVVLHGLRIPTRSNGWRLYDLEKAGPDASAALEALKSFLQAAKATPGVFPKYSYDINGWRFRFVALTNNSARLVGLRLNADPSAVYFDFQWSSLEIVPTDGCKCQCHRLYQPAPEYDEPDESETPLNWR